MKIGSKLQQQRKLHHMSQNDLADKLQISRQSISKWENGTTLPSFANVIAISELFDVSLDELIKGDAVLMDKFKNDDKIRLTGVETITLGGMLLGAIGLILFKTFSISNDNVENWLAVPLIISFFGLISNLKWQYINQSLNKKAVIWGTIFLTIIIIFELISILAAFKAGLAHPHMPYKY